MKYYLTEGQAKEKILNIDGRQSVCPYTAPIPFPGNMGQIQIMRMPCSTLCPLAEIKENQYVISCGSQNKSFDLLVENGTSDTEEGKLIIL